MSLLQNLRIAATSRFTWGKPQQPLRRQPPPSWWCERECLPKSHWIIETLRDIFSTEANFQLFPRILHTIVYLLRIFLFLSLPPHTGSMNTCRRHEILNPRPWSSHRERKKEAIVWFHSGSGTRNGSGRPWGFPGTREIEYCVVPLSKIGEIQISI